MQNPDVKNYLLVTGNYWAFTLTDGALRMLVVLYFYQLGYSPLQVASLFLFYELFGVITNLFGGYLGARIGLNRTMNIGLALQVLALCMLAAPVSFLTVPWVMSAQALSGIAKDLNKMSAKSSVKALVSSNREGTLFKYVAMLTGSKNALKGVGFFLGGALLSLVGFTYSVIALASALLLIGITSTFLLRQDLGKTKYKPKFHDIFSKSRSINILSAARFFLFGARDIWFVVALPVFLSSQFGWSFWKIGGFLAAWVIGYGFIQAIAPNITGKHVEGKSAAHWATLLTICTLALAVFFSAGLPTASVITVGLCIFGVLFAINSSVHSYLCVAYAREEGAALDVGFYYMANAMGRLVGTLLSGWIYQQIGMVGCMWATTMFVAMAALIAFLLPPDGINHHE